jgi:Zn-dependent membrane protease YugP
MLPRLSKSSSTRASFRTIIVSAANIGSYLGPWLVIIGIMLMGMGNALGQSLALARMEVVDRAGHLLLFFAKKAISL